MKNKVIVIYDSDSTAVFHGNPESMVECGWLTDVTVLSLVAKSFIKFFAALILTWKIYEKFLESKWYL